MQVVCPNCSSVVASENISLDAGWGKCGGCQDVFRLEAVLPGYRTPTARPPEGRAERPFDARVHLERSATELLMHLPAEGMRAGNWVMLGFATFWLGFVAFWTCGALGLLFGNQPIGAFNWGFAAFSIPFWLVGFGMLGTVIWKARGTKTVRIDSVEMVTQARCLGWKRTRRIAAEDIQSARIHVPSVKSEQTTTFAVEIVYQGGSFVMTVDTPAEQSWLIAEINEFLATLRR